MTSLTYTFGLLGIAAFASGTALAQEADKANPPSDWTKTFVEVAGEDGVISEAEYIAYKTSGGEHSEEEAMTRFADIAGDDALLTYVEVEAIMAEEDAATPAETTEDGS